MPHGLIFKTDSYIPLDAVVKRSGTDLFINIPKLIVGKMPWDEPPSRTGQYAKHGARAIEVDKLYGSRSPSGDDRHAFDRPRLPVRARYLIDLLLA
ncbi:MAG: hypothetical protein ACREYE_12010 [Gammaproteobacteria bacterium]